MHRPTFFISSTIYDFRDLRSALKFHLEEQGCKVLASEFNDFEKPLDKHSYEACLQAIHSADYFVLLVGSRVGGWYDAVNQVSITQREYREAYQVHTAGKLKLLNFVRSEVWQAKDEHTPRRRSSQANEVDVETAKLAGLLHLLDRWSNVLDLSASILRHLDGEPFVLPNLRPDTPVQGMQSKLDAERPSESEITSYVLVASRSNRG